MTAISELNDILWEADKESYRDAGSLDPAECVAAAEKVLDIVSEMGASCSKVSR